MKLLGLPVAVLLIVFTSVTAADAASCLPDQDSVSEAMTVQATVVPHPGHTWSNPGYSTIDVTTTGTERCISLEEDLPILTVPKPLRDKAEVNGVGDTSWEVLELGKAEEVQTPTGEEEERGEPAEHIRWSCAHPEATYDYTITTHGQVGPTITATGQVTTITRRWCASTREREKLKRRREAARHSRERPKREAEEKKERAEERREEASPLGQAKRAFVKAAHAEGRYPLNKVSAFGTKCRQTGSSTFVCSWLWIRSAPHHDEQITATVRREHKHYYVGPFRFNE